MGRCCSKYTTLLTPGAGEIINSQEPCGFRQTVHSEIEIYPRVNTAVCFPNGLMQLQQSSPIK